MAEPLLCVLGPTASGKSALALELAQTLDAEIITCDSAQVFRGLDIGTAKPTRAERARVKHHLIDEIPPTAQWTAAEFRDRGDHAIAEVRARGRVPILCGGTGLWYRALVHGIFSAPPIDAAIRARVLEWIAREGSPAAHARLRVHDPEAAARIAPGDPQRIGRALEYFLQTGEPISRAQRAHGFKERRHDVVAFGLRWPKEALWTRIQARTRQMYADGLVEEAAAQIEHGVPDDAPGLRIIGYRDAVRVTRGELTRADAEEATAIATRQFAKRQRNWFNHEPTVEWVDADAGLDGLRGLVLDRLLRSD